MRFEVKVSWVEDLMLEISSSISIELDEASFFWPVCKSTESVESIIGVQCWLLKLRGFGFLLGDEWWSQVLVFKVLGVE
jgi:hypothetical protein